MPTETVMTRSIEDLDRTLIDEGCAAAALPTHIPHSTPLHITHPLIHPLTLAGIVLHRTTGLDCPAGLAH